MPKRSVSVWTPFWGWVFYDPHLSSDENCYAFLNHIYWLVHKYPCLLWNWVVESPWITYVQQKQVFSQCSVQGRATDNCWNLSWSLRGQYVDDVLWVALKPHRKNQTLSDTATTQSFWTYFFLLNKRFVSVSIHELKKVGPGHVVSELCSMPKVSPLCLHGYWKCSHAPWLGFHFSWRIFSLANAVCCKARQPKHFSSILAVPRNMSPVWTSARGKVMFCLQSTQMRAGSPCADLESSHVHLITDTDFLRVLPPGRLVPRLARSWPSLKLRVTHLPFLSWLWKENSSSWRFTVKP